MPEGWNSRTAGRVNLSSYEAHSRHAASSSACGAPAWLPPPLIVSEGGGDVSLLAAKQLVACGAGRGERSLGGSLRGAIEAQPNRAHKSSAVPMLQLTTLMKRPT